MTHKIIAKLVNVVSGALRWQAGQTLLEILLAFSISVLVLSAIVFGVATSLSNTQYAKNQGLANSYAQEGMAVVRQIRDSGLTKLTSYTPNTRYCLKHNSMKLEKLSDLAVSAANCEPKIADIFSREVIFEHNSDRCCSNSSPTCENGSKGSLGTVTVSWSDSKCPLGTPFCHGVKLISCFFDIDQKQAP